MSSKLQHQLKDQDDGQERREFFEEASSTFEDSSLPRYKPKGSVKQQQAMTKNGYQMETARNSEDAHLEKEMVEHFSRAKRISTAQHRPTKGASSIRFQTENTGDE